MSEASNLLTAKLLDELPKRYQHIRCWRNNRVAAEVIRNDGSSQWVSAGVTGQADISGIVGPFGRRLEIEVKVGKDRLREAQGDFRLMVLSLGGVYVVAHDLAGGLAELENQLREEERERYSADRERSGRDGSPAPGRTKGRSKAAHAPPH